MFNPFDEIIERLNGLENKLLENSTGLVVTQIEIIGRDELCKRLAITEPTAIRWEKKGKIPCFRIGSSVRYNWQTVMKELENKKKGGTNL